MEGNLLNEISYLTQLIERHKKNTSRESYNVQQNTRLCNTNANMQKYCNSMFVESSSSASKMHLQTQSKYSYVKPQVLSRKVHVNPNFKSRNSTIHINPKINTKPSVYVNPKMMRNITAVKSEKQNSNVIETKQCENDKERKVERSVYVNPKLMREISAATFTNDNAMDKTVGVSTSNCKTCSKLKLINNRIVPNVITRRTSNSSLISLSRRKLIRVRRNIKGPFSTSSTILDKVKKTSCSVPKETKLVTRYKLVTDIDNYVNKSDNAISRLKFIKNSGNKIGSSKYKIDRTVVQRRKHEVSSDIKRAMGSTMGLVRIGGILYKSSRNQLVRSINATPSKKKRCIINVMGDRFIMASNGKKLRRLNSAGERSGNVNNYSPRSRVDIGGMTFVEKTPNVLVRSNTKNHISNKVKQKSIQILRNKMRKNNQPCLLFQRFGYCTNQANGTCPKLHDKKQIALCKKFLQGKCLLDNCPMSHNVGPEKMPTCKYFLEGCCNRDACPYLHVKVSSNTPICVQFLRGYCAEATKCKQRHVYMCPEFDRRGSCTRGKYCPYPHKEIRKRSRKIFRKKDNPSKKQVAELNVISVASSHTENKKRYYEETDLSERINKKKEVVMKKIKMMKRRVQSVQSDNTELNATYRGAAEQNEVVSVDHETSDTDKELNYESERPKRPPIGPLPPYIPID